MCSRAIGILALYRVDSPSRCFRKSGRGSEGWKQKKRRNAVFFLSLAFGLPCYSSFSLKHRTNAGIILMQRSVTLLGATFAHAVWQRCCNVLRHAVCCWLKFQTGRIFASNTQLSRHVSLFTCFVFFAGERERDCYRESK